MDAWAFPWLTWSFRLARFWAAWVTACAAASIAGLGRRDLRLGLALRGGPRQLRLRELRRQLALLGADLERRRVVAGLGRRQRLLCLGDLRRGLGDGRLGLGDGRLVGGDRGRVRRGGLVGGELQRWRRRASTGRPRAWPGPRCSRPTRTIPRPPTATASAGSGPSSRPRTGPWTGTRGSPRRAPRWRNP